MTINATLRYLLRCRLPIVIEPRYLQLDRVIEMQPFTRVCEAKLEDPFTSSQFARVAVKVGITPLSFYL